MAKRTSKVAQMATDRQMHTGVTPCGVTFHIATEISVSALQAMHEKLTARIAARAAERARKGVASAQGDEGEH
jgi:hypothetical protein